MKSAADPMTTEPIAVLGGTFDPVHYGHLRFADEVRRALGLSRLFLLPSGVPPHREGPVATAQERLDMLQRALAEFPGLVVDERELHRPGKSYTVVTLQELRREFPDRPLILLLGADAFRGLPSWHRWRELFELAHIVIVARPGTSLEDDMPPPLLPIWRNRLTADPDKLFASPAGSILVQPISPQAISATTIREQLATENVGDNLRGLLPPAVLAYIELHHLYHRRSDAPK
jgi:nicotinate-nucleotide adenylyltransferase